MTAARLEIIVEGSNDGGTWEAYVFPYKPQDIYTPPPWVAPHQPRLDWQMWFAALGRCEDNPWFVNLLARLLDGSDHAADLLTAEPPEPDSPLVRMENVLITPHSSGVTPQYNERAVAIFEQLEVSVDLITTSEISVSVTIDEKHNQIELTEKGIDLITDEGEDPKFFIMPDIGVEIANLENDADVLLV